MHPPTHEKLQFPSGGIAADKVVLQIAALDAPAQAGPGCLIGGSQQNSCDRC
jgi:hypothetical protein